MTFPLEALPYLTFFTRGFWTTRSCSCYFAVASFSTIGYGDLVPEDEVERIFTSFYVLTGVSTVAVVLGLLGSNLIDVHDASMARAERINQRRAMRLFYQQQLLVEKQAEAAKNNGTSQTTTGFGGIKYTYSTDNNFANAHSNDDPYDCSCGHVHTMTEDFAENGTIMTFAALSVICLLGYLIGHDEGWSVGTTIYYGLITGTKRQETRKRKYMVAWFCLDRWTILSDCMARTFLWLTVCWLFFVSSKQPARLDMVTSFLHLNTVDCWQPSLFLWQLCSWVDASISAPRPLSIDVDDKAFDPFVPTKNCRWEILKRWIEMVTALSAGRTFWNSC